MLEVTSILGCWKGKAEYRSKPGGLCGSHRVLDIASIYIVLTGAQLSVTPNHKGDWEM